MQHELVFVAFFFVVVFVSLLFALRRVAEQKGEIGRLQLEVGREQLLRQEADELSRANPHPAWLCDPQSQKILSVNDAMIRVSGYTRTEFLRLKLTDLAPPESWADIEVNLKKLPLGHNHIGIQKCRCKDGTVLSVEIDVFRYRDQEAVRDLVFANDVTQRVKMERQLRHSERTLQTLVDSAPMGIATAPVEGDHFDTINPAMREILGGYSLEEARALDISRDVYLDIKDRDRMIAILRRTRNLKGFETHFKHRDGRPIRIRLGGTLVEREGEEPYFQKYVEDLTQQNALEQQVRQVQKLEAVGRLAGGMAHDFNNVLVVIKLSTEMMLEHITPDNAFSKPLLQISNAADRAAALTRQMLAFGRQQMMQPRIINVNAVMGETSHMLRRVIGEDIQLITKLSPDLYNSHLDPDQLSQVILNLAVNARDAMPDGGVLHLETANAELDEVYSRTHPPAQSGSYVMLAVSDTGSGIDKAILPRIFDPFFTTKEVGKGTGLGLSIVYGIVKQSGGYIWVYSEPGHGTTFKVYLPATVKPVEQPLQRAEGSGRAQGQLLLVVEDEHGIRNNVRECLQQLGYRVLEAEDGESALQLCDEHPEIQAVLTDLVMPRMGGYPMALQLAERHPSMRVLFMSGYTEDSATRRDILLKGCPFLQKPFSVAELAQSVHQVLALRPPLPLTTLGVEN